MLGGISIPRVPEATIEPAARIVPKEALFAP